MIKFYKTKNTKKQSLDFDKRLIMWTGIIFFTALITVIWILNIKNNFKTIAVKNNFNNLIQLDKIISQFNDTINHIKQTTQVIRNIQTKKNIDTKNQNIDLKIKLLRKKLEEEVNKKE